MSISVVYLAYYNEQAGYGLDTVKNFLDSYKRYSAGMKVDLKFIAKNWTEKTVYEELLKMAKEVNAEVIDLPDDGWDLGAYFRAAEIIKTDYLFFFGSSSEILADNWLLYFYNAFKNDKKIKMAGAMGSWEDPKKNVFPNFHIRTCSFMIERKLFLEYASSVKFPVTKWDTYQLEHGEISVSNYVLKKGNKIVLVNSDGNVFEPEDWPLSDTYRTPYQKKILISDKQALKYPNLTDEQKRYTEMFVWAQTIENGYIKPEKIPNMFETKIDMFISSRRNSPIFQSLIFHPIFNGKFDFEMEGCSYVDYYNDNIAQKHLLYGDLTGYYQIWKNFLPKSNIEYVGFCQDSKFFDFKALEPNNKQFEPKLTLEFFTSFLNCTENSVMDFVQNYDVVLLKKTELMTDVTTHYAGKYSQKYLDLIINSLGKSHPEYKDSIKNVLNSKSIYELNCFIMRKELFNEFMAWLFGILDSIDKEIIPDEKNKDAIFHLAQILLNIWLENRIKESNLKIGHSTAFQLYDKVEDYINSFFQNLDFSKLNSTASTSVTNHLNKPDSKVKIFASYYKPATLIKSNVFEPIFNGASGYAQGLDVLTDDTGISISEKNKNFGELTQQYWVWKNYMPEAQNEYIGFCQYHRFLDFELTPEIGQEAYQPVLALNFPLEDILAKYTEENIYNYIKNYDIVLPTKITFGGSNYTQYAACHKKEDMDKALQVIASLYPDYIPTIQEVMSAEEMYIYGAFIMKKELLNEYMDWIFNILFHLESVSNWKDYDEYNRRTPAFIAERFLTIWIEHNIKTRKLKVKNTTSQLLCENLDLYLREALFMMERLKVKDLKKSLQNQKTETQPEKSPDPQVKIFSIYYKPAPVFESNVFKPIYNGSAGFALPAGALTDNTEINISYKNPHYGELTQNYWVWKNYMPKSTSKYIGFCHYRRFLDFGLSNVGKDPLYPVFINDFAKMFEQYTEENIMKVISGYDIVIPNKFHFDINLYDQYLMWHPKKDLDLAIEVLNELYPEYSETANEFLKSKSMYICLTYVMKKELVNEFFEWIFNILTELEKRCNWGEYTEYFHIRMPAFIAERFFNIWLEYNIKKRNLKVLNTTNVLISYDAQEYTQKCLEKMEKLQAKLNL